MSAGSEWSEKRILPLTLFFPPQLLLVVLALATAFPSGKYAYQRPGPNDARSPCPGLNALANHGFINRDGRNIRGDDLINAALQAYNVAPRCAFAA